MGWAQGVKRISCWGLRASPQSRDLLPVCSFELNSLLFTSSRAGGGILKKSVLVFLS